MANTTANKSVNNEKFFSTGDTNAKQAFYLLGQYCGQVMTAAEKYYADKGEPNKFRDKMARLITARMTYRVYGLIANACDEMAIKADWALFKMSGDHKQAMAQSEYYMPDGEKKIKMAPEEANQAFSLGLWQKI
jgi:hypothetical protein